MASSSSEKKFEKNDHEMFMDEDESSEDSDDEYEEVLVYVDFPDFHGLSLLTEKTKIELTDLAGPNPKCKINDTVNFSGEHQTNLGTMLFFSRDQEGNTEYYDKTVNCLRFGVHSVDINQLTPKDKKFPKK